MNTMIKMSFLEEQFCKSTYFHITEGFVIEYNDYMGKEHEFWNQNVYV